MTNVQEAIASLGKVNDMDLDEVETADKKKDKKKKRKAEEADGVADAATNGAAVQGVLLSTQIVLRLHCTAEASDLNFVSDRISCKICLDDMRLCVTADLKWVGDMPIAPHSHL